MKNRLFIFMLPLVLWTLLFQCTKEEANPVGSLYFQRNETGSQLSKTLYTTAADTFYHTHVATGARAYLHVGNDGETQAKTLIRFSGFPKGIQVDSASLKLYISQWIRENGSDIDIRLSHLVDTWSETSITWNNFEGSLVGDEVMQISIDASNEDSISIDLPESVISQWSDTASTSTNYGLFVEGISEGQIIQFYSYNSTYTPVLTVYTTEDTTHETILLAPTSDSFISDKPVESSSDYLRVSNGQPLGVPTRSLMYFEIPELPVNATVNGALLNLAVDTTLSIPNQAEFALKAYAVSDNSWPVPDVPYDSVLVATGSVTGDSAVVDMSDIAQNWVHGSLENHGIILMSNSSETTFYERFFYSSATEDSMLTPRLTIYYSVPPVDSRF